jgi:hypothetical protein
MMSLRKLLVLSSFGMLSCMPDTIKEGHEIEEDVGATLTTRLGAPEFDTCDYKPIGTRTFLQINAKTRNSRLEYIADSSGTVVYYNEIYRTKERGIDLIIGYMIADTVPVDERQYEAVYNTTDRKALQIQNEFKALRAQCS